MRCPQVRRMIRLTLLAVVAVLLVLLAVFAVRSGIHPGLPVAGAVVTTLESESMVEPLLDELGDAEDALFVTSI